ncbi:MAG: copper amine oxidase N-terminal domain-containing protein, partial [Ruthenibacterium sp.]
MMKKFLTMVLALVMVLGCMTPALAASYPATPEPAPDWDNEAFWEQRMREERKEMGMPYPDGINVRLDAKYLTFKSARPIFRAGRVMAPAAELLAQLGGKVTVAKGNISATFPDGSSIRFTMGDKILHAKNSVESASLNMDAPPYYDVKTKTTYIPLRNVADALDLDIEWDDDYKVVYLTDWAKLAKDTDKEFSVLNTILAASAQAVTDKEKTYSSKDSVSLSGSLYKENGSDTATMSFGGESLVKGNQFCGDYTAKLELGGFRDLFAASLDEKQMKLLDNFKSGGYSVRGDLHGGTLYMKGSNLAPLSE